MRPSSTLLAIALPSLCLAQDQVPLGDKIKGWFNKATSYIPSAVPSAVNIPNPVNVGTAKVASKYVHQLTGENWKSILVPSPEAAQKDGPEEWLVFFNGGNKTCYGLCAKSEAAWNASVTLLSQTPSAPNFATVDCDAEQLFCNAWVVAPPAAYQFFLPKPLADQSTPATTARYVPFNRTSISTKDFLDLHNNPESVPVYEGFFHPFDGLAQKTGLVLPWSWGIWGFSVMPSWLPMILISFFSRTFMKPRVAPGQQRAGQPATGGAAPAPAR